MLVINADDWGRSQRETDAALACVREGRVGSVSAMVFMQDSNRAAELAGEHRVDVGLHLNFNEAYSGTIPSAAAAEAHRRILKFMRSGRRALFTYHPLLRPVFRDVFLSQADEFARLFGHLPTHIDGHQHRHLCLNMLIDEVIPRGYRVRRNFTFAPGEKSFVNRAYRALVDRWLARRYKVTDYLFNLADCLGNSKLGRVFSLAQTALVELETHPCRDAEFLLLMSDGFGETLAGVQCGRFALA